MFAALDMGQKMLVIGGILSLLASAMHIAIIVGGPDWYRFFGAGEAMAQMAEKGSAYPVIITLAIAAILAIWAWFAFAGAGLLWRPPLLRTGLFAISAVYLLRGLVLVPMFFVTPDKINAFAIWSSLIVLIYGFFYSFGTWKSWASLS
ncbi:MAG: hypothetical protein ABJO01_05320 [Parasphingorhabdus sp.]